MESSIKSKFENMKTLPDHSCDYSNQPSVYPYHPRDHDEHPDDYNKVILTILVTILTIMLTPTFFSCTKIQHSVSE